MEMYGIVAHDSRECGGVSNNILEKWCCMNILSRRWRLHVFPKCRYLT